MWSIFDTSKRHLWDNFETSLSYKTTFRQVWKNIEQLWHNFDTTLANLETTLVKFWHSFKTILGLLRENLETTGRTLGSHSEYKWLLVGRSRGAIRVEKNLAGICAEKQLQSAAELFWGKINPKHLDKRKYECVYHAQLRIAQVSSGQCSEELLKVFGRDLAVDQEGCDLGVGGDDPGVDQEQDLEKNWLQKQIS